MTTVIFQQIAHKPTKFKKEFAAYIGEMYPVRLCLHVLPDASLHVCRWFLVGPVSECFGSVRFLFERYQAGWISQQKVVESAGSLNFYGESDNENDNCNNSI